MNLPQTSSAAKTALTSATKSYPGSTPSFVAEREPANEASTNLPTAAAEREQAQPASPNMPTTSPDTPTATSERSSQVSERESTNSISPNPPTAGSQPLTTTTTTTTDTTNTKAPSISTTMQPGAQEPPAIPTAHGTDVSNNLQVHSSWSRFSRKVRDIITGTELHDEAKKVRKEHKKAQKKREKAQKQHEKLQAQRAASLKQLAQSGWNVKDVRSTEKGN